MDFEFDAMFEDMRREEADLEYSRTAPICTCELTQTEHCPIHGTGTDEE